MEYNDIIEILLNKKFNSENWIKKTYPDFHYFIFNYFEYDISWKEKFYLYRNNITDRPLCYCGNNLKFIKGVYLTYCSKKCMSNSDQVKSDRSETNIKRYGYEIPLKNEKIRERISNNLKEKGVTNVSQLPEVKERVKETNLKKYGVEYVSMLKKNKEILSKSMNDNQDKLVNGRKKYIINTIKNKIIDSNVEFIQIKNVSIYEMFCLTCNNKFDIHKSMLNDRLSLNNNLCTICNPINSSSDMQNQLLEYVKTLYDGKIISNTRKVISKELDIYLPELKIAFEFNGIYWHSSIFKDKNYHFNKSLECEKLGITLIHIWEDEWLNKNDYIKSKIKSLFTSYDDYIIVENVDDNIISNFLFDLYIDVDYKYSIGIFSNGLLVSLLLDNDKFYTKVNNTLHLFKSDFKINGDFLYENIGYRTEPVMRKIGSYEIFDSGYIVKKDKG